ncbi:MAG: 3-phosphoshikimate 1-carboxyvinyltransferase [Candidatus Limivicinus sp.]
MDIRIRPVPLHGAVTPPPSKSQAHRLILCAALAEGRSIIRNLAFSQDIRATLGCVSALGASWTEQESGVIAVDGIGGREYTGALPHLDCGESGSTLRFLIPIALAVAGGAEFSGRGRLMQRPQKPYFDLFDQMGIKYEQKDDRLRVEGRLKPGEYRMAGNVSSQFFTGLLYALPLLEGQSRIIPTTALESEDYIRMTIQAQALAGLSVEELPGGGYGVEGQRYRPMDEAVEADWSQAGFWYAAKNLGSDLTICGMDEQSLQGDRRIAEFAALLGREGDREIDVSQCPDLVPPLAAMAALRKGDCRITGAARLRIKESDRLAAVTAALNAMGAEVEEFPEELLIHGVDCLKGGAIIDCCNDHRIAMMCAVAATRANGGETVLQGAECVRKSYPDFWQVYRALGGDFDVLDLGE